MMDLQSSSIALLKYIPQDMADGEYYEPLPSTKDLDSLQVPIRKLFNQIATTIENIIEDEEPYEISLVGLKPDCQPVILIGLAHPVRIEAGLLNINIMFPTHVRQCYPAVFGNDFDRTSPLSPAVVEQTDVPAIGTSCGILHNPRHSVSLGAYLHLSTKPKSVCLLTVPPTYTKKFSVGDAITQPSLADRIKKNEDENKACIDVVKASSVQDVALHTRRAQLEETFELGKIIAISNPVVSSEPTPQTRSGESVQASEGTCLWALAEVTRATTSKVLTETKPKPLLPFMSIKPSHVEQLTADLIVTKQGRATDLTCGIVNSIKSVYRLPNDGQGVRRHGYIVLSYPWGGIFAFPGDSGAIVYAHEQGRGTDAEGRPKIYNPGVPCGMVVAASTSKHITFIQPLDWVLSNIKDKGFGNVTFLTPP